MTHQKSYWNKADEQELAAIIRGAGARTRPPEAAREAVYAAVHTEWRAVVASRTRARWRTLGWSLAATLAVATVGAWLAVPLVRPAAATVAEVVRSSGPVTVGPVNIGPVNIGDNPGKSSLASAQAGTAIVAGTMVGTGQGGRAALRIGAASVRIDEDSLVAFVSADQLVLRRGAVYVDTGGAGAGSLRVGTPLGTVEHLGTQYETRLVGESLRVSVREGRVAVDRPDRPDHNSARLEGVAGERLTVESDGAVQRQIIGRSGEQWAWTSEIAPAFAIDERPLPEFLHWVSRETGLQVAYASPAVERQAEAVILRGSVTGLTPAQALTAVLATTELQSVETDGVLLIEARAGKR